MSPEEAHITTVGLLIISFSTITMRLDVYVFLVLSAICAGVMYLGNNTSYMQFTDVQNIVVVMCFAVSALVTLTSAINGLPDHESETN